MIVLPLDRRGGPSKWRARIGRVRLKALANVQSIGVPSALDIDPARVLAMALEQGLTYVVVVGWNLEGDEYFASSAADGGTVLWLLKRCEKSLLAVTENEIPRSSSPWPA